MSVITVGVLTPHAASGPEAEFPAMAPGRVRTVVSRLRIPAAAQAGGGEPPSSPAELRALTTPAVLDEAAAALPGSVDVLALASTSSGYAIGYDAEAALLDRLRGRWHVPACGTALATVSALRSHRIERISLVHPPWFGAAQNRLGVAYFESQGFEVVDAGLADLPDDPDRIEAGMVVDWVTRHTSDRAEAVVLGGNGFRAARAIGELEGRLGRLVLAANQVLLWSVLTSAGAKAHLHGFGVLLDEPGHPRTNDNRPTTT